MQHLTVIPLHVMGIQCVLQALNQKHPKKGANVTLVSIAVPPVKVYSTLNGLMRYLNSKYIMLLYTKYSISEC